MTAQLTLTAIESGMNDMIEATTIPAPKKVKRPAKPAKPAKAEAKPIRNEKVKPEPKPEPVMFKGFEVKEGTNVAELEKATEDAKAALESIQRKDVDLLSSYLTFGGFQSEVSKEFKSTKLYGQFLAKEMPATQSLDPALRSNCKWLYEALNVEGHEASDLLTALNVNRLEDYKSGNPTVIKREYKAAKAEADKAAALKAKADAEGVDVSEAEKLMKEEAEAQAKKDQAQAKRKLTALEKKIAAFLQQNQNPAEQAEEASSLIRGILESSPKDQIAYIESIVG